MGIIYIWMLNWKSIICLRIYPRTFVFEFVNYYIRACKMWNMTTSLVVSMDKYWILLAVTHYIIGFVQWTDMFGIIIYFLPSCCKSPVIITYNNCLVPTYSPYQYIVVRLQVTSCTHCTVSDSPSLLVITLHKYCIYLFTLILLCVAAA